MQIFCVAEHRYGELSPISFEILHLANRIKGDSQSNIFVLGKNTSEFAEQLAKYADKVWAIEDEALENYTPDLYMDNILNMLNTDEPVLILIGDTPFGKDLAPYLAVKHNAPVQTDVVDVDLSDGVSISKYALQGKVKIEMKLRNSNLYILTVRQKVFKEGPEVKGEIVKVTEKSSIEPRRNFIKYIEPEVGDLDISKEDVLITVGKGIGEASKIKLAEELARLLGGVVAGTRPVIDNGWLTKDRQVGVSGKVVEPKLYFGLGVSGAFQHVMGMSNSDLIVGINKDPEALIFEVADYCIIGDVFEIVPALVDKLRIIK